MTFIALIFGVVIIKIIYKLVIIENPEIPDVSQMMMRKTKKYLIFFTRNAYLYFFSFYLIL